MSPMETRVAIQAAFAPLPGQETQVETVLRRMVGFTRAEPGCRRYDLFRTEAGFLLHEVYDDQAALEAHRAAGYFADYRRDIVPLLAWPITVTALAPLDAASGNAGVDGVFGG